MVLLVFMPIRMFYVAGDMHQVRVLTSSTILVHKILSKHQRLYLYADF